MIRRIVRTVGVLMIVAGLAILGWFAWQYWGTNVVAHQKQEKLLKEWTETDAIGILHVPRFGHGYRVAIRPGGNLVEPKGLKVLDSGSIAWYEKGARPGAIGNFVIAGHRVTHGEPFADFPKLKTGDKVIVETRSEEYTYVLRNGGTDVIVPFTVQWPLWPVPDPDRPGVEPTKAVITMVTCSELFHTNNRSVAIGDLTATKPLHRKGTPTPTQPPTSAPVP